MPSSKVDTVVRLAAQIARLESDRKALTDRIQSKREELAELVGGGSARVARTSAAKKVVRQPARRKMPPRHGPGYAPVWKQIVGLLEQNHGSDFEAAEIAARTGIKLPVDTIRSTASRLAIRGVIRKMAPGKYRAREASSSQPSM